MSALSSISKPASRPVIMTVCGDAGTGKTSLAATFPNPIFVRAEDGMASIPTKDRPDAFPLIHDAADIWPQLMALLNDEHDYKTLVIDSVSRMDEAFTREILEKDGRAKTLSTALGGYGAGYQALAASHARVRKAAGLLNERRGMNIVFISHADIETMRLPDTDDYNRYSLRLNAKSLPSYIDDVDCVAFVRLVSALKGDDGDRKKVISDGTREIICHATAASVSKNRFGITEPLEFEPGINPFLGLMPIAGLEKTKAKKPPAKTEPETETEMADGDV